MALSGQVKRTVGPVALTTTLTTNVYNQGSALIYDVLASSDMPDDPPTRSPLSVELFPNPQIKYSPQTRDVGKSHVPIAFGMRHR